MSERSNGVARLCYWANRLLIPVFDFQSPLAHRDGLDLTGWTKDDDGTYWFTSHSMLSPSEEVLPKHPKAIRKLNVRVLCLTSVEFKALWIHILLIDLFRKC